MKKKVAFIVLFALLGFVMQGVAQTDTEFWFAAPDLDVNHAQVPIRFCVVAYDAAANVVFEQPANAYYSPQTFHVNANDCVVYDVSDIVDIVETQPYNTVLNYGFHIHADAPVSIYYESDNNNSEIYSLKGSNALGTNFVVPMQYTYENYYSSTCSRIEVVATEDITEVTFYPSVAIKGGGLPGVPVTVTLNRGQSYAIEAASREGAAHLRNTRVTATKPIAVNSSDDSVNLNEHYDLVGDQIVPVNLLGTQYIAIWNNNSNEYLYFFPTEDDTEIYLNGGIVPVATLNVGEEFAYHIQSPVVYINASHPLAVFQLSSSTLAEMGGTILPQISCTGSRKIVYKRQSNSNLVVTIIVRTAYTDGFLLNGNANQISSADFHPVPDNPDFSYCKKDVTAYVVYNGLMAVENTYDEGYFHLGILTGIDGTWNYGYFSDYQSYAYAQFEMDDTFCAGESIHFEYAAENVANLALVQPDGTILTQPPFIIENAQPENSGRYALQGDDCLGTQTLDEIDIEVRPAGMVEISLEGCNEVIWNGHVFDHSIDSTWTVPGGQLNACDSTYHLHVNVFHDETVTLDAVEECDAYTWRGTTYTASGTYQYQIATPDGCLYTEYLPLTIHHSDTIDYDKEACEEYVWHGLSYTQSGQYTFNSTTPEGCDRLERLSLTIGDQFRTVDEVSTCGSYYWPANQQTYYESVVDSIVVQGEGQCDSTFVLHLDLGHYDSYPFIVGEEDNCDGYLWDPQGHDYTTSDLYDPENHYYIYSGVYQRTYTNIQGCDSIVTMTADFDYTPNPTEIYPVDSSNVSPHWVVTATEFQINSYDFTLYDQNSLCHWDSITWSIENDDVVWILEPDTTTNPSGKICRMYVLNYVEDTVWLQAKVFNRCKPEGETRRYWFVCSFFGIEENGDSPDAFDFNVVPNPNNGQMVFQFTRLTDKVDLKVYDMTGKLIDNTQINSMGSTAIPYNLDVSDGGIYCFIATSKEGSVVKKVIIKR